MRFCAGKGKRNFRLHFLFKKEDGGRKTFLIVAMTGKSRKGGRGRCSIPGGRGNFEGKKRGEGSQYTKE